MLTVTTILIALLAGPDTLPAADDDALPGTAAPSGLVFDTAVTERLSILRIAPDSPAAAADLRPGDVVLTADQRVFVTPAELEAYLSGRGDQPVHFDVLRGGERTHVLYLNPHPHQDAHVIPRPRYGQQGGVGIRVAGSNPVVIVAVYRGSPADRSGILPGDELLTVNDVAYDRVFAVTAAIAQHPPGMTLRLGTRRDGVARDVALTPEDWTLAFDEPPHVLSGWSARNRRIGCYAYLDDFALRDPLLLDGDTWAVQADLVREVAALREELRAAREELAEFNRQLRRQPLEPAGELSGTTDPEQ